MILSFNDFKCMVQLMLLYNGLLSGLLYGFHSPVLRLNLISISSALYPLIFSKQANISSQYKH